MEDPRVQEFQKWLESREKKSVTQEGSATDVSEILSEAINTKRRVSEIRDLITSASVTNSTRGLKQLFSRQFRIVGGDKQ